MEKSKSLRKFEEYEKPNGKWGWFHFYNPSNGTFAHKCMYEDDNTIIDNWWIWRFQEIALRAIFGAGYINIKEEKLLEEINNHISKIYDFIKSSAELKYAGMARTDCFVGALCIFATDYKKIMNHVYTQDEIAGLFMLLIIDVIIRDCKYKYVEDILFSVHQFHKVLKILYPEYDAEKEQFVKFGKKKGEQIRQKVEQDYRSMGDEFWEKETKYDDKIRLLESRYGIGTTTAKKYYSMLKKLV